MRFVEDEFLLATRVGPPDTQERLAKVLAINEARRARAARRHLGVVKPVGARVVVPFVRTRRHEYRAGR